MIISVLVIAVLIGRAAYLQIYQGEYYAGLADGNRIRIVPSMAPRGTFYDRNGELLVTNRPGFSVSLLPLTAPISDDVIDRLSDLLKVPTDEIKTKIAGHSGFNPIRIKTDVTPDIVSIIEEQKSQYPGVVIEVTPIRDYILKQEGAHTFGYVSEINDTELEKMKDEGYKSGDIIGKFGLEKVYDKELRGENGGQQVEVDVSGKPVQILGRKEPVPGDDLELTIDINLQQAAEKAVEATFGRKPLPFYSGGSIPIISGFESILGIKSLLLGFGLAEDAIHSPNESYGLEQFDKGVETIPLFYKYFAES